MNTVIRIVFWIMYAAIVNHHELGIFTAEGLVLFLLICLMMGFEQYVSSTEKKS